ncbi:ATP-binding protein [Pseudomonas sp. GL-B-16]|uniref:ATP-binding protein n=1 Tax=Pseudomonas sp. GL-B-16 TaxID=2832373 RepID=UPI001CBC9821|nr:ATP-binding protein [Pseudomonas sp. GL-B-16]
MTEKLELKFDPNTIEHLGVSLYSQLPSVLSELISNSWDADAETIRIDFQDDSLDKTIKFIDDGHGMTLSELNDNYLVIGRNRRKEQSTGQSPNGRKVIGKKGLGKLAVFGICNVIEVISVRNGTKNHFLMNIDDIKQTKGHSYSPEEIVRDEPTTEKNGTTIYLKGIRRKTGFDLDKIALSISKKFTILDRINLNLSLNGIPCIKVTNELKYDALNRQFSWDFPDKKYDENYQYWDKVKGEIITLDTPVKDTEMRGIYLVSRGKIVNTASFYGTRDNDQFHNYVTGYLEVDFIDEFGVDVISTDRHSLNWENDQTKELQLYLSSVIKKIGMEWKQKRRDSKRETIQKEHNRDITAWQNNLPTFERELSHRIIDPILSDTAIDTKQASTIIDGIIDKFDNKSYKDYASHIADISSEEDIPKLLKLMDDWKSIEAKQFKDLAYSRIEVIKQFEEHINTNTKEVPTLHNFLKKFSWLLDPRILEFRDEVTYSKLLKETFSEESFGETDRRIDFLCSNALGEILYVIEIKRSKYKVDLKALEQGWSYGAFLKDKYASSTGFSKVVCFVVGGEKSDEYMFKMKEKTYMESGEVFVKTYRELLEQSKEYHKEFISAYDAYNPTT